MPLCGRTHACHLVCSDDILHASCCTAAHSGLQVRMNESMGLSDRVGRERDEAATVFKCTAACRGSALGRCSSREKTSWKSRSVLQASSKAAPSVSSAASLEYLRATVFIKRSADDFVEVCRQCPNRHYQTSTPWPCVAGSAARTQTRCILLQATHASPVYDATTSMAQLSGVVALGRRRTRAGTPRR